MASKLNQINHVLSPSHTKLTEKEKKEILETYKVTIKELPMILDSDPGIANLNVKTGDVIKIERNSPTAGTSLFYRTVVTE